jgi:hypothetical protein
VFTQVITNPAESTFSALGDAQEVSLEGAKSLMRAKKEEGYPQIAAMKRRFSQNPAHPAWDLCKA